ncbi:MAG: SGNH/GDSL hydrolase family protein, partial [Clostridia bacterium]|nr:SGNH/GDSL hydrolase family protein [Clostridia bacterium]
LFGKVTRNGGKLDILVDGEKVKTIDCAFTGGWGNYVEAAEIIDFDECGIHTVEIVPKGGKNAYVVFSALTLTK